MRIARFLLPGLAMVLGAGPAVAQPRGSSAPNSADLVPSVRPASAEEPVLTPPPMPPGRPPAAMGRVESMGAPGAQPWFAGNGADPVGTLTGQPTAPPQGGYPAGSYPSPYYTDGPGCCGPTGGDGRVSYELYSFAGVNFTLGNGLPDYLKTVGWTAGGGVHTLFFNPSHTAAWTVDFGGSYTYNRGQNTDEPVFLFLRSAPVQNQQNGGFQVQPDRFVFSAVRGIHRSSFNFAVGRDVWLLGDGSTGSMQGTNCRIGGWIGGKYGTSHIDIVPLNEIDGYSRRQNVFHGIYFGTHATADVPLGAWVWTNGIRFEYGHDWTNLAPPLQGNIHNISVMFTTGIRY